jgi:alpha-L-rhamnosidase
VVTLEGQEGPLRSAGERQDSGGYGMRLSFAGLVPFLAHVVMGVMSGFSSLGAVRAGEANLALGKACETFSSLEDQQGVARLTDGQAGPGGWRSKAFGKHGVHQLYPEYVVVDLKTNCLLRRVVLHPAEGGKGFPEDFSIYVCREGEPWRKMISKQGYAAAESAQSFDVSSTEGRYVKVEATRLRKGGEDAYRFQLSELEVWGEPKKVAALEVTKSATSEAEKKAIRLRCENRDNPQGMDEGKPRFSWWMQSSQRGDLQTAYQILVASNESLLKSGKGDVWDSGQVKSDQNIAVRYAGKQLKSAEHYVWKVMLWDKSAKQMAWSEPASFLTGKFSESDWQGKWIGVKGTQSSGNALGFAVEAQKADEVKWVQIDLGASQPIDHVVLHPKRHQETDQKIDGYGFPVRFRIELSEVSDFSQTVAIIADHTKAAFANPGWRQVRFDAGGQSARYVRLTVTQLWKRLQLPGFVCTLGEMDVFSNGNNIALDKPASASGSVEGHGWSVAQLTDGNALASSGKNGERKNPHGAIYLQKKISVTKPITRATAVFCGLGWSELSIDGRVIDNTLMAPGFTSYDKRTQYLVRDVTQNLAKGDHTLDVILLDGWYALEKDVTGHGFERLPYIDQPKMRLDIHLKHSDGTETVVSSDETWRWSEGPITRSWLCEADEDRRIKVGRNGWNRVSIVKAPQGLLVVQKEPPTCQREELRPISLEQVGDAWVYRFDREFNGHVKFKTQGAEGTEICVSTKGVRETKGSHDSRERNFRYIFEGKGVEEFAPRNTYAGIARASVRGLIQPPKIDDLVGCRISGSGEVSGDFHCSNDQVNWLHNAIRRTQSNYVTYLPNDNSREYKAWMQDPVNMFRAAVYLFDSQTMYERWQYDMINDQVADGNLPNVSPGPVYDPYNSAWWGGTAVWLPWHWYLYYGDSSLLEESYPAMKRYVDFLAKQSPSGVQDWGLSDWYSFKDAGRPVVNTPAAIFFADVVSRTAFIMGKSDEAKQYAEVRDKIKRAFNEGYLDINRGVYGRPRSKYEGPSWHNTRNKDAQIKDPDDLLPLEKRVCTQGGQVLPLMLNVVPDEHRQKVEEALLTQIKADNNLLTTGFVGTPYLLMWLGENAPQLGWELTTTQKFPSWYKMSVGSDSEQMMETWDGGLVVMPSLGGNLGGWNMETLAGIRPDHAGPGFKRIIIKPAIVGNLHWTEGWYDSVRGRIESKWRKRGGQVQMTVTIPANTVGTVYVPARTAEGITESGKPASKAEGVRFLRMEKDFAVFEVGSGRYDFEIEGGR